jgi:hypothetical protein
MQSKDGFMKISNKQLDKEQPFVIGLFKDHSTLENTLTELKESGFWSENIAILMSKHVFHNEGSEGSEEHLKFKAKDVATTGLITGVTTGGILGWLASLDTFLIPSLGLMVAAGPLASALTGIAIGGTIGSLGGAFIYMGISKLQSKKMEDFVKDKGVIVSVHIDSPRELLMAKNILVRNNAVKIYDPPKKKLAGKNFIKLPEQKYKEVEHNL